MELNRRTFLKGTLTAGVVAASGAALAACSPQATSSDNNGTDSPAAPTASATDTSGTPNFLVAPDTIADDKITSTVEAEVVVVGAGVAGLAAARAAAEKGAKVAVIEKAETYQYRSGQYGIYNSKLQQQAGMDFDAKAAVSDLMKEMGYRPNQVVWNYWVDKSGEAFDWLLEPAGNNVDFISMDAIAYDASKITIQPLHFPAPASYDPSKEYSPTYPEATVAFIPDQGGILELTYQKALELGVEFHFANWARQLIRPNNSGRVEGIIAEDIDGNYIKFTASKAVILCAGDYGSNEEMVKYYNGGRTYMGFFSSVDAKGEITNVGDGHKMGAWIGAKIEDGPHAPMTHTLGTALGVDAFFLGNANGYRFVNEDVAGQQISTQLYRQPGDFAWQIFDDKYPEQVELMGASHGSVNHIVDESANPHLEGAWGTIGRTGISSRQEVESAEGIVIADTLEDLISKLELSDTAQKSMLTSIARYNELCTKGRDDDFGKVAGRMFPIEVAPFYACKMSAGAMLVCLGGLTIEPESLLVVDTDYAPIEGLYAAGNNMGCRILQDYPVTIAGVSHATALVFGYLTGLAAATT
jgi:succinate dehydrogenase/fumarate reductase flavoprotein subunit